MNTHPSQRNPSHVIRSPTWVGTEWVIDALGCDENSLRDLSKIIALAHDIVADLGLKVVGDPQSHQFPYPGGVTLLFMLSESHLTCHTYPEHRLATFNLHCCRERETWPWSQELRQRIAASEVTVRKIIRGDLSSHVRGTE